MPIARLGADGFTRRRLLGTSWALPRPYPWLLDQRPRESEKTLTRQLTGNEQQWLRVRNYLRDHRYELTVSVARE